MSRGAPSSASPGKGFCSHLGDPSQSAKSLDSKHVTVRPACQGHRNQERLAQAVNSGLRGPLGLGTCALPAYPGGAVTISAACISSFLKKEPEVCGSKARKMGKQAGEELGGGSPSPGPRLTKGSGAFCPDPTAAFQLH